MRGGGGHGKKEDSNGQTENYSYLKVTSVSHSRGYKDLHPLTVSD